MFVRRDIAPLVSQHWYNKRKGADTAVSLFLCEKFRGVCTGAFTVNYVVGSSPGSNGLSYFEGQPVLPPHLRQAEAWRVDAARQFSHVSGPQTVVSS